MATATGGGLDDKPTYEVEGGDPQVRRWQMKLNDELADVLPEKLVVDGLNGAKTITATRLFEWRSGKPITGMVGKSDVVETHGGGV